MQPDNPLYVAEIDEHGHIECVWYSDASRPTPRPVRRPARHLEILASARFSGASPEAITGWLTRHAASGMADPS